MILKKIVRALGLHRAAAEAVRHFVLQKRPQAVFELRDDIIRIAPV